MSARRLFTSHLRNNMVTWRHDFHRHPELGFGEHRTAARVAELLESFGLTEVHKGVGGTGVVGVLDRGGQTPPLPGGRAGSKHKAGRKVRGGGGGGCLAIRADMDALPFTEVPGCAYVSTNAGVMHACGHDGHTSMLLGAAAALAEMPAERLGGRVLFVFQPAEEHGKGAKAMLDDGLFSKYGDVERVYGMHNIPGLAVGTFETRGGPIAASESLFEIRVEARGGHAAMPHMGVDAILVGSEMVSALQSIVARKLDPGLNGVVSVTGFEADGQRNVLAGNATLSGDARALTPQVTAEIERCMRQLVGGVAAAHGVSATVSFDTIFPATINDAQAAAAAAAAAASLPGVGAQNVVGDCSPQLFSEDFAHMATAKPGAFVLMGNGLQGRHARPLHSADYDFNDEALEYGSSLWVQLALDHCKRTS